MPNRKPCKQRSNEKVKNKPKLEHANWSLKLCICYHKFYCNTHTYTICRLFNKYSQGTISRQLYAWWNMLYVGSCHIKCIFFSQSRLRKMNDSVDSYINTCVPFSHSLFPNQAVSKVLRWKQKKKITFRTRKRFNWTALTGY